MTWPARIAMREWRDHVGGGGALGTDEVPRHGVRLVVIDGLARRGDGVREESVDADGIRVTAFAELPALLRAGDLVVVNDAATLPASLHGRTASGAELELRLTRPIEESRLYGVLLGAGDYRTRTEDRPAPPAVKLGDRLWFGEQARAAHNDAWSLELVVTAIDGRLVELAARIPGDALWQAIYAAAAPVQYAHRSEPLPLWSVQTAYAARPWAVEMPSAGRPLTWDVLLALRRNGIELATLTHAAGLSSIGDAVLDRALPFPERYELPRRTVAAIAATRARGGRVIAVGTTVVRALEAAAQAGELVAGSGVATLQLDAAFTPRIVDGVVSGLHAPGESHFELLQAFAPRPLLERAIALAARHGMSSHELGDACLVLSTS